MRTSVSRLTVLVAIVLGIGPGAFVEDIAAQNTPYTGQVPCARVLALGGEKLGDLYRKRHPDDPKAEVWASADYTRCKRVDNDARLKLLPAATQTEVLQIRKDLNSLIDSFFALTAIDDENANGDTKAYEEYMVANQGKAEDLIAEVMSIMSKPSRETPVMRIDLKRDLARIQLNTEGIAKSKRKDLDSEAKGNYNQQYSKFKSTIESVVTKIRSMPAAAGLRVARFIDDVFGSLGD